MESGAFKKSRASIGSMHDLTQLLHSHRHYSDRFIHFHFRNGMLFRFGMKTWLKLFTAANFSWYKIFFVVEAGWFTPNRGGTLIYPKETSSDNGLELGLAILALSLLRNRRNILECSGTFLSTKVCLSSFILVTLLITLNCVYLIVIYGL